MKSINLPEFDFEILVVRVLNILILADLRVILWKVHLNF